MKKKLIATLLAVVCAVCCAIGLAACDLFGGNQTVEVERVVLDQNKLTMNIGEEKTLRATITPSNATNKTLYWVAEPEGIVTVDNGKVKAVAAGEAVVMAMSDKEHFDTCVVTVNETQGETPPPEDDNIPVTSITLNKTELTLEVGDEETLTAMILPDNATDKTVTWGVDNAEVAIVVFGKVTAVGEGTARVIAFKGDIIAECVVTVNAKPMPEVTLDKYTLLLDVGASQTLTASAEVEWSVEDAEIASVDSNGKVTAIAQGTTFITATAEGSSTTCAVTVKSEGKTPTPGIEYALYGEGDSYYVKSIGSATDTDIVIASEYEGKPVTVITSRAFASNINLTSVTIPDSVTLIEERAFYYCTGLTDVTIGSGITSIEKEAFLYCHGLKSVVITGNEETVLGQQAFYNCENLVNVLIVNSIKSIGTGVFASCYSLTHITIGSGLESIGALAFDSCDLAHIIFKGTVEQWNAVSKGWLWNSKTGVYTVHCTDGDIAKK